MLFQNLDIEMEAHNRLIQTNNTCEGMWVIYQKLIESLLITMLILPVASVLSNWLIDGSLIVDHFYRTIKTMFVFIGNQSLRFFLIHILCSYTSSFSLPWDQSTVIGYFGEQILINAICFVYSVINGVLLLLFISICLHHRTFYEIIRSWIDKWNNGNGNRCDLDSRKLLCDLIRFHMSSKKLVKYNTC